MKKVIKIIFWLMAFVLCFSCSVNITAFAENISAGIENLSDSSSSVIEKEETDYFFESEMEAVLAGEDWYLGENGESYDSEAIAGGEQPEDYPDYSTFDLDDPDETTDLNIAIPGITGLMSDRRTLANYLEVQWDTTHKFMIQGGCSDGEYVYYAFNVYTINPRVTLSQKILCAKLSEDGKIDLNTAIVRTFTYLDHANSLTYNSKTDQVIVANCYSDYVEDGVEKRTGEHYRVTVLNAAYLRGEEGAASQASYRYIPCYVTSIAYDEYMDQYIVGITGKKYSFAILNSNFYLEKIVGYQPGQAEPDTNGWARNDIWCDHSNIYSLVIYKLDSGFKNILMVFDKNGIDNPNNTESVKAIEINLNSTEFYEAENIFKHGNKFLIGYSYVESASKNNYGYIDISQSDIFKVDYCPNYNNDNNITSFLLQDDSTKKSSHVIHYASTRLMPNKFANTGYKFKGWAAYWVEGNRWYCTKSDGTRSWLKTVPSDGSLYLYADKQKIAKTVPKGNTVVMVAQWVATDKFYVKFLSNDDNNLTLTQQCTHGVRNTLEACSFINAHGNDEENAFLGWHAHWVEGDKWYYQSADGSVRSWHKEGEQPSGYKKYVYSNSATVAQTVPKGHTVEMHAFWNEFKIYYFAGAKLISFNNILTPSIGIIRSNTTSGTNMLKSFDNDGISDWYAYYLEKDKWYYKNGDKRGWYTFGAEPDEYTKYINSAGYVRNTVAAGDSLVLCWKSGTASTYDFVN